MAHQHNSDSLLVRALQRKPVSRTPVWVMRQAGRYLPEYREVRAKAGSFLNLCKNPRLACEVALQPLRRFSLDAAILFSDILTIPDAMGLGLSFEEGEGPRFKKRVCTPYDIDSLPKLVIEQELDYVLEAVSLIRASMPCDLPLIGFSGSPWTLACYMIEGSGSRDFKSAVLMMYQHPKSMALLLQKLSDAVFDYLEAQIKAGVNVVMLFDTWGGLLSSEKYMDYSLNPMQNIITRLKKQYPEIPVIVFTKGGGLWLNQMADTGCDALGLDWVCDLRVARQQVGARVSLQGNLDPTILCGTPSVIRHEVASVLERFGRGSGHVFNLGHGITPDVPPEHLAIMIDAVHELSPAFHHP